MEAAPCDGAGQREQPTEPVDTENIDPGSKIDHEKLQSSGLLAGKLAQGASALQHDTPSEPEVQAGGHQRHADYMEAEPDDLLDYGDDYEHLADEFEQEDLQNATQDTPGPQPRLNTAAGAEEGELDISQDGGHHVKTQPANGAEEQGELVREDDKADDTTSGVRNKKQRIDWSQWKKEAPRNPTTVRMSATFSREISREGAPGSSNKRSPRSKSPGHVAQSAKQPRSSNQPGDWPTRESDDRPRSERSSDRPRSSGDRSDRRPHSAERRPSSTEQRRSSGDQPRNSTEQHRSSSERARGSSLERKPSSADRSRDRQPGSVPRDHGREHRSGSRQRSPVPSSHRPDPLSGSRRDPDPPRRSPEPVRPISNRRHSPIPRPEPRNQPAAGAGRPYERLPLDIRARDELPRRDLRDHTAGWAPRNGREGPRDVVRSPPPLPDRRDGPAAYDSRRDGGYRGEPQGRGNTGRPAGDFRSEPVRGNAGRPAADYRSEPAGRGGAGRPADYSRPPPMRSTIDRPAGDYRSDRPDPAARSNAGRLADFSRPEPASRSGPGRPVGEYRPAPAARRSPARDRPSSPWRSRSPPPVHSSSSRALAERSYPSSGPDRPYSSNGPDRGAARGPNRGPARSPPPPQQQRLRERERSPPPAAAYLRATSPPRGFPRQAPDVRDRERQYDRRPAPQGPAANGLPMRRDYVAPREPVREAVREPAGDRMRDPGPRFNGAGRDGPGGRGYDSRPDYRAESCPEPRPASFASDRPPPRQQQDFGVPRRPVNNSSQPPYNPRRSPPPASRFPPAADRRRSPSPGAKRPRYDYESPGGRYLSPTERPPRDAPQRPVPRSDPQRAADFRQQQPSSYQQQLRDEPPARRMSDPGGREDRPPVRGGYVASTGMQQGSRPYSSERPERPYDERRQQYERQAQADRPQQYSRAAGDRGDGYGRDDGGGYRSAGAAEDRGGRGRMVRDAAYDADRRPGGARDAGCAADRPAAAVDAWQGSRGYAAAAGSRAAVEVPQQRVWQEQPAARPVRMEHIDRQSYVESSSTVAAVRPAVGAVAMAEAQYHYVEASFIGGAADDELANSLAAVPRPQPIIRPFVQHHDEKQKLWHYKDPNGQVHGPCTINDFRGWLAFLAKPDYETELEQFRGVAVWKEGEEHVTMPLYRLIEQQDRVNKRL